MPWTICLARSDGTPLGDAAAVEAAIQLVLPDARFFRNPSGQEKAALLPEEHRETFLKICGHLPATRNGSYEADGFSLEFFLAPDQEVKDITVDVRGNGNPLPTLRQLCTRNDWIVRQADGKPIELDAEAASEWARFVQYRDAAVQQLRSEDEPSE
jgi:hypothetical protein